MAVAILPLGGYFAIWRQNSPNMLALTPTLNLTQTLTLTLILTKTKKSNPNPKVNLKNKKE